MMHECAGGTACGNGAASRKAAGLWLFFSVLVAFVTQRLPYFFISKYETLAPTQDAIWWWMIQQWFVRGGQGLDAATMHSRIEFRLPTDIFWQKFAVDAAQATGADLFFANLVFTSALLCLAVVFVFMLGLRVLRAPQWAALLSLFFTFSVYAGFLRYGAITPKMFGFTLFPLMLYFLHDVVRNDRFVAYAGCAVAGVAAMFSYFISFAYLAPSIAVATFVAGCVQRYNTPLLMGYAKRQVLFWGGMLLASVAAIGALKGFSALVAPPIEVTESSYTNHNFALKQMIEYLVMQSSGLAGVALAFWVARKNIAERVDILFFATVFACLFLFGFVAHAFAAHVDFFRVTWYWRAGNYAFLPACVCMLLGLRDLCAPVKARVALFGLSLAFFGLMLAGKAATFEIDWRRTAGLSFYEAWSATKKHDFDALLSHLQAMPAGALMFMPAVGQGHVSDLLEAEGRVPVLLSRNDSIHGIYVTEQTKEYTADLDAYRTIMALPDAAQRLRDVAAFAKARGVSHMLALRENAFPADVMGRYRRLVATDYEGGEWVVYCFKASGLCAKPAN